MPGTPVFANREIVLAYLDSEKRFSSAAKLKMEHGLRRMAPLKVKEIKSLEELSSTSADLIVVSDPLIVEAEAFKVWLDKFQQKLRKIKALMVPAIIVSSCRADILSEHLETIIFENWYFDLIHPDQIDSVPIRVANLIRIHDHIKELAKYDQELIEIRERLKQLEKQLESKAIR